MTIIPEEEEGREKERRKKERKNLFRMIEYFSISFTTKL